MLKKNGPGRCCCLLPGCEHCKTEFVSGWSGNKDECVCVSTRNYEHNPSSQLIQPTDRDSTLVFHGAQSPPFLKNSRLGDYFKIPGGFLFGGSSKFRGSYALEIEASGVDENAAVIFKIGRGSPYDITDYYNTQFLMGRGVFSPWADDMQYDWGTTWNNSPHKMDGADFFVPTFDWPVGDPVSIRIEFGHVNTNLDVLSSAEKHPDIYLHPTHWWVMYVGGTKFYSGEMYGSSFGGGQCAGNAQPYISFLTPDTIKYLGPWYVSNPGATYEYVVQDEIEEPNLPTGIKIHSVKEYYDNGLINCPSFEGLGNSYSHLSCGMYGQVKLPENTYPQDPDAADDCPFYESGMLPYIRGEEFPSTTASLQFSGVTAEQPARDNIFYVTDSTHDLYRSGLPETLGVDFPSRLNWLYTREWDDFQGPEVTFVNSGPNPNLYGLIWISKIDMRMWNFNHQNQPYPRKQTDWQGNVLFTGMQDRPPNNSLYIYLYTRFSNPIDPLDPSLVQDGGYLGSFLAQLSSGYESTLTFEPYYRRSPPNINEGPRFRNQLLQTGTITLTIGG